MSERSWVLGSGYGSVAVFGARPVDPSDLVVGGTVVHWLDVGMGEPPLLLVRGGSQFGPFAVTLRLLAGAPVALDASWEDVAEVSIDVRDLALGDLEDGAGDPVDVASGTYRLRVSARGRAEGADRESTFRDEDSEIDLDEPLEHFLLELWPAAATPAEQVRETSRFAHELVHPPEPRWPAEREPGLAAARRVAADLRDIGARRRRLSGELGTARLSVVVPGTRATIFNRVKLTNGWPTGNGGTLSPRIAVGDRSGHYADPPDSDGLAPLLGLIEMRVLEIDKPRRIALSWNWRVAGPDGRPFVTLPWLLEQDSTVVLDFAKAEGPDEPRTRVTVTHSGVPREWEQDLQALWAWDVARFAAL